MYNYRDQGYGWVGVVNETKKCLESERLEDLDGLIETWQQHLNGNKPVNYEVIKDLALRYHIRTGKWILFSDQGGKVDHLWSIIATSVIKDNIPCHSAKVSTNDAECEHVICIYNTDFTDTGEVLEAEKAIRQMGIKGRLQYKPDIYTDLFIYAGNEWGLKPFIMTSQFDLSTRSSIIKSLV